MQGGSGGAGNGVRNFLNGGHGQPMPDFLGGGMNSNTMGAGSVMVVVSLSVMHCCACKLRGFFVHECRLTRSPGQLLGSSQGWDSTGGKLRHLCQQCRLYRLRRKADMLSKTGHRTRMSVVTACRCDECKTNCKTKNVCANA